MSSLTFTKDTLVSFFRAAAEAIQNAEEEGPQGGPLPGTDYPVALENYVKAHGKELGTLANWIRKKYSSEPTPAKAKSLLTYAIKQVEQGRAEPSGLSVF